MGSDTQSRLLPQSHLDGVDTASSGVPVIKKWLVYGPGAGLSLQVTTSYRTGRRAGGTSVQEDSDTALLSATNYRDRFKVMKTEYQSKPKSALDNGHEFKTQKAFVAQCNSLHCRVPQGFGSWLGYDGSVWPSVWPSGSLPNGTYKYMAPADLGWYGPRAISATTPTNPATDVATALGELWREGIPLKPGTTIRRQARLARKRSNKSIPSKSSGSAGGEYLNVEFGWKPLIRDLRRTALAVKRSNKILRQHSKNSGKSIRRRYTFPEETTFTSVPEVMGVLNCPSGNTAWKSAFVGDNVSGVLSESIETIRRVSFSGAYTYTVGGEEQQGLGRLGEFEQKANLLLGSRITPETLWNIAPWSWLADWKGNIGDNIANATALSADGLIIRYGYLMVTSIVRHTYTLIGPREKVNPGVKSPYSIEFVTVTKERYRASPFGFGSDPASFTSRQWAILAALGMTRGDRALRLND